LAAAMGAFVVWLAGHYEEMPERLQRRVGDPQPGPGGRGTCPHPGGGGGVAERHGDFPGVRRSGRRRRQSGKGGVGGALLKALSADKCR
jgi:hypothetical protein